MKKDETKIPLGMYCYCKGGCPYYKIIESMRVDFGTYISSEIKVCEFLEVNTVGLMLEKPTTSWLLQDECKICGINMNSDCE